MSKPRKQPPQKIPAELKKEESDVLFEAHHCFTSAKRIVRYIKTDGINPKEAAAIKEAVSKAVKVLNEAASLIRSKSPAH
jgi:hypothetical protein